MSLDVFQRPGRFYRGNLHTHFNRSDGKLAPEARRKVLRQPDGEDVPDM